MRLFAVAVLLAAIVFSAGCSFDRAWEAAASAPPGGLAGQWEGIWKSDKRNAHGGLKCAVRQIDAGSCEAYFHATQGVVFALNQAVRMRVWRDQDEWHFSGSEDLGVMNGGLFEYDGHVHGDRFVATYRSPVNFGTFILRRVHSSAAAPAAAAPVRP